MDFRRATALFADPTFDGDPVQIYEPGPGDPPVPPGEVEGDGPSGVREDDPPPYGNPPGSGPGPWPLEEEGSPPPKRYIVHDVPVTVVLERVQYLDENGKLITESLISYTRKKVLQHYASLDAILSSWTNAERKQTILDELSHQGVFLDELAEQAGTAFDPFDLVCHAAFDRPPLTLRDRAGNVKKRDVFGKYEEKARAVLTALLEKYADAGIASVESLETLKIDPLRAFGTPMEIVNLFGGKPACLAALRELETALYLEAA